MKQRYKKLLGRYTRHIIGFLPILTMLGGFYLIMTHVKDPNEGIIVMWVGFVWASLFLKIGLYNK